MLVLFSPGPLILVALLILDFTGKLQVLAVENPVVECIMGNVVQTKDPAMSVKVEKDETITGVVTRQQKAKMEKSVESLPCHDSVLADRDTFRALQKEDQSLRKFWKQVGEERKRKAWESEVCGEERFAVQDFCTRKDGK